jgi:hypothetical protein
MSLLDWGLGLPYRTSDDQSRCAVWSKKCLSALKRWDRGFDSQCLQLLRLCYPVYVAAWRKNVLPTDSWIQKDVKKVHLLLECISQNSVLLKGCILIDVRFISNAIYRIQNGMRVIWGCTSLTVKIKYWKRNKNEKQWNKKLDFDSISLWLCMTTLFSNIWKLSIK